MNNKLFRNIFLSILIPCIACAVQWVFWDKFQPFIWFLFYPSVFFSAQISGRWGGLVTSILSVMLVIFFFVEPIFSLKIYNLNVLYSLIVFIFVGILLSNLQEGFKRTQKKLQESEYTLRKLKNELEERIEERALELQKTEERYRRFFEHMHEAFIIQEVVVDETGKPVDLRYLDLNPAAERILGKTHNEIIGQTRSQLAGRPDPEGVEMASRVASTGEPFHMTRYSPGFRGWFESFTYSLGSGIVATLSLDITERKQAEEKVEWQNERLKILREIDAAIMAADSIGDIIHAALSHVRELTGCRRAVVTLLDWETNEAVVFDVSTNGETSIPKETRLPLALFQNVTSQTLLQNQHFLINDLSALADPPPLFQTLLKEGLHSACILPLFSQGSLIGSFNMSSEITGFFDEEKIGLGREVANQVALAITQNNLTEKLRDSQARTAGIINSAMDAIISVNTEQIVVLFNTAAEKMFGCLAAEAIGKPLESFIPERFHTAHHKHIRTFGETGVTNRAMNALGVILGLRANGEEFPIEASISQIELDGKKFYTVILRDITKRKLAEAQIEYQAHLLANVSDAIIATNEKQIITAWNHAAEDLYGWKTEEALGKVAREVVRSELTEVQRAEALKALAEGGQFRVETLQYHRNGQAIWAEGHTIALRDDTGKLTGFVSVNHNITERKRAEQALRESEVLFRQAIEAAGAVPYSHNYEMNTYTFMGEGILALTGYPAEEMTPTLYGSLEKQVHMLGESSHLHPTEAGKLMRAGQLKKWRCDSMVLARDGTSRWIADASVAIFDGTGKTIGSIGILQDITERKQSEETLRQSQENFAKAFNSNPAAIAITRLVDGKFISLNPAYTQIMEYEPHEILGHTAAEINIYVHPEERNQVIQQLREQGAVQNYELLVRVKSGETRNIVISMVPILYNQEECILSVFLDISERKKMEQELQRSNAELEQFAYVASHDLQEPLRAVAGMVQLLQQRYQGRLDERADEYIGHAVDASARMQRLINDLLDYSRVDRFGKPFATTDLENCLKTALANLQLSIQESNTQITHEPLPTLMADVTQMTQVLQNLIGNAIKFRGEGPLHIHLGAKKIEQAWQFEVRDNGIGIEPKYFERIFLVFQRLHTRREYPGTGIGLSLCKKIIERHGGRIWVESQLGQGSTFYFTIPERQL